MQTIFPAEPSEALPPGANTPKPRPSSTSSRRETILSLVEMLLQERDLQQEKMPSFEDDRDVPTVDEHLQVVGAEAFNRFQRRINSLDRELRNFANAARQLGSSVAILSSAFHLRERLAQILFLYRQNAADLFPRKITHHTREVIPDPEPRGKRRRRGRSAKPKAPPHVARPTVNEDLDPEFFPEQLEALAADVATFLRCLNEFPEFTDEAVNTSIHSFEGDLKYWASCLKEYTGHFRYPSVQRYIHDLSEEMGEHIDSITSTLSMFIEVGVPTIRFAQKHGAANLLNLSTVATFFSAVTATTMQFSYNLPHTGTADAVNCFWFASMVFSIAAAVNSLLGLTWKQAMYRSPGHRVPWWVLIWIKRSPLVFLVMSVACFSIGLCLFAYASEQAPATSTLTTVFTAFTSFGLAAVSAWFASERYIFLRHRGKKWLSDALIEYKAMIMKLPGVQRTQRALHAIAERLGQWSDALHRLSCKALGLAYAHSSSSEDCDDLESGLPTAQSNNVPVDLPTSPIRRHSDVASEPAKSPPLPKSPIEKEPSSAPPRISHGKQLWKNALRSVQMRSVIASPQVTLVGTPLGTPHEPYRRRTTSSELTGHYGDRKRNGGEEPVKAVLHSRVTALQPKLRQLEPTQDVAAHQALVRHLQFSPDGKYLATSSWDRTSVIFRVGDPLVSHRILGHAQGCRLQHLTSVWSAEDGVCKKTIDRKTAVEAISWFPDGKTFISVEGSDVTKLDLNGNILNQYYFGRMKLHDVAVTPDSVRLIGVGPLLESPTGLQPSKSRAEKRLVVYNMETCQIENQTPVLNDVKDITVVQTARSGVIALISYENKAPPQLWKLEMVKDRENNSVTARLTLRHTYMPKVQVDFAGPSYFGGKNNELVLCAGKAGDIHIWDQESGALLHHLRGQAHGGDLTCIAWNHAAEDPFMFATGSHDGGVRIWTKRPEEPDEIHPSSILRTHSPFEITDRERSESALTQQDRSSDHTHDDGRTADRDRPPGSSSRRTTSAVIERQDSQTSTGQSFRERILAYAAAQRAAQAQTGQAGSGA
ncbi:putative WD domain, G-beta repeat [Lyophyllum shimeji]|uniref:WD domain, G-beta repeat n=1 Tax=Lyophyllum shimeji TaxID=47721 RepID=A0A9P3PSZ2_LYOSH|nr:putative WD domain, G-beta repeat [Lyophyllum shimeji]